MANASDTSAGSKTDRVPFSEVFPILVLVILVPVHAMSYALYTGLGVPFPESVATLIPLAAWLAAYAWFDSYRRRHGLSGVMDMGYFFYLVWWLLVPYYLLRTQRFRALLPLGALLGYAVVAWVGAFLVQLVLSRR